MICVHEGPCTSSMTHNVLKLCNCVTAISDRVVLGMNSVLYKCEEKSVVKIYSKILFHSYLSNCISIVDFFYNLYFFMHTQFVLLRTEAGFIQCTFLFRNTVSCFINVYDGTNCTTKAAGRKSMKFCKTLNSL